MSLKRTKWHATSEMVFWSVSVKSEDAEVYVDRRVTDGSGRTGPDAVGVDLSYGSDSFVQAVFAYGSHIVDTLIFYREPDVQAARTNPLRS
ncbi:hypothetical protein Tco_0510679 [Tanacetum coccineum]